MAEVSKPNFAELVDSQRWDAEAYTPFLRDLDTRFAGEPELTSLATVTHPAEIPRVYSEAGDAVPFLRAQNIRPFLPDMANLALIPSAVAEALPTNRLEFGDVLVTRSGAFSGVATVFLGEGGSSYSSGEGIIVRSLGDIDGAFLAVFFNTTAGAALCRRAIYGSGQPHVGRKYLEKVRVPRCGALENKVADLVRKAHKSLEDAKSLYPQVEAELLNQLGWRDVAKRPRELTYASEFSTLNAARRSDAEFFHPHAGRIYSMLAKQRRTLDEAASIREEPFVPEVGRQFHYIEIGNVEGDTTVTGTPLLGEDAPDRAQYLVRANDVVTSTVRPIRRLSGLVAQSQDGWVCSSGFAVLTPHEVPPEYLVAYLRLAPVCELMDAWSLASMYPAVAVRDLMRVPFFIPDDGLVKRICAAVREVRSAKRKAEVNLVEAVRLLEEALR